MSKKKAKTFTCQVRVQRTTVEYGYVNIALTPDIVSDNNNVNAKKIVNAALVLASQPKMVWYPEEQNIVIHPEQQPQADDEESFDVDGEEI